MATVSGTKRVELGFVVEDETDPQRLLSHYFPSKVGGKPAWLSLKPIPDPDDLKCGVCGAPTTFLLQAYATIDDKPSCFHRTLFVFICRNPECCQPNESANVIVLRSQLPRQNEFYSDKAPGEANDNGEVPNAEKYQTLCLICGCAGNKKCAKCQSVTYCSKEHQVADWTNNGHKRVCGSSEAEVKPTRASKSSIIFKEFELDYGVEYYDDDSSDDDEDEETEGKDEVTSDVKKKKKEKSNEEKMEEYRRFIAATSADVGAKEGNLALAELEKMAAADADKTFTAFKKRISQDPEQVLRYERGGQPLCITDKPPAPTGASIPRCNYCQAERRFEFQIMPQLLTYLDVDTGLGEASLDWGVLAVYTCSESCDLGAQYGKEFVWKQDIVATKKRPTR